MASLPIDILLDRVYNKGIELRASAPSPGQEARTMFNTRYAEITLTPFRDPVTDGIDTAALDAWLRSPDCTLTRNEQATLAEWAHDHNALVLHYVPSAGVKRGEWLLRWTVMVIALLATLVPVVIA